MSNVREKVVDGLLSLRVGTRGEKVTVFVVFLMMFVIGVWCLWAIHEEWYAISQKSDWQVLALTVMGWCATLVGGGVVCVGLSVWFLGRLGCKSV